MRVLAVVADLAQVSQVMFANCRLLFAFTRVRREWWRGFEVCWGGSCMAVGALGWGQGAAGREEGEAAYLVVWRQLFCSRRKRNGSVLVQRVMARG